MVLCLVSSGTIRIFERIEIIESQVINCCPQLVDLGRARSFYVSICVILRMRRLILLSDMSIQHDVFDNAIDHFSAEEEEIRTAAAFAAGERSFVAVGESFTYL